jgi:hypothetical protein
LFSEGNQYAINETDGLIETNAGRIHTKAKSFAEFQSINPYYAKRLVPSLSALRRLGSGATYIESI